MTSSQLAVSLEAAYQFGVLPLNPPRGYLVKLHRMFCQRAPLSGTTKAGNLNTAAKIRRRIRRTAR